MKEHEAFSRVADNINAVASQIETRFPDRDLTAEGLGRLIGITIVTLWKSGHLTAMDCVMALELMKHAIVDKTIPPNYFLNLWGLIKGPIEGPDLKIVHSEGD